ncbi:MAG: hypothetical protein KatS3mg053_3153 [Candidatus Roseilinea sp.]|nr:MAG: hypothetical protein KatS3mg053_3153 [Candidatus Roseilinea sp.]
MLKVGRDIMIARSVEEVFAFVSDFDNFTRWSTDVVKAELLNGRRVGVGTRARITRRALGQHFDMLFEMVHFEPPARLGFKGEMLGIPFRSGLRFDPLDAGARVTQIGEVVIPPLLFLVEPTARQVLATTFENDLRKLKQVLESDGHA